MTWDHAFDLVVIGSGAAGMAAALRAHDLGMKVVILEKSDKYGGSTAISGGVCWVANNPTMASEGISDSREEGLAYLRAITRGEVSEERLQTYADESLRVVEYFRDKTHLSLKSLGKYTDYYAELPGGKPGGRSMEADPFDARELGPAFKNLRRPHPQSQVLGKFGITAREAHTFLEGTFRSKLQILWRLVQWLLRWPARRGFERDTQLTAGNALIGRLRRSLMDRGVPLWLNTGAEGLVLDDGRVVGVEASQGDKSLRLQAKHGVLLAAGGFEQNQAMREKYLPGPTKTEWNAGNPHNVGTGLRMGIDAGGALDLMDEAWWTPVTRIPKSDEAWVLVVEKSLPGGLMVGPDGRRFTNEAAPYQDVVYGMYKGGAVPGAWLIFDAEFRKNYPVGPVAPGYAMPDKRLSRRLRDGFLTRGRTLTELAEKLELPAQALAATIERFNEHADKGIDPDFRRGENAADRYYGDARVTPNPTLRALRQGPFYAIPVFPGDLGTKGGLVTDGGARVLRDDGSIIAGLYAAGNCSSAVMGRSYPGAGGTIGPALTFGFLAAESAHAAGTASETPAEERAHA